MDDSLDVLEPESSAINYNGQRLEIQPLVVGQIPSFVRKAKPIIGEISNLPDFNADDFDGLAYFLDLIERHGEILIEAIAIATKQKVEFIQAGNVDELYELVSKVVEVNHAFFVQRLRPLMKKNPMLNTKDGNTAFNS